MKNSIPSDFLTIKEVLQKGGVICYPTETVYGLGCDPFNRAAVEKVFKLKERKLEQSPLLLIPNKEWVLRLAKDISKTALQVIEQFWPGPLTLVLNASSQIPSWLIRDDESIALRISSHPWVSAFLNYYGFPIVSTSANKRGAVSSQSLKDVKTYFPQGIDYTVDGGELSFSRGSTIVSVRDNTIQLIRSGDVTLEQLKRIYGQGSPL
ncbi:MAG: threonylcarbamoyl-AMP synthase [Deltaproteobacteria bacterium GWA2_38_16]|nr:MAG: threonylcarbamoyl-AMP synthase [Deltaproteobacteria bacterium GWA2_38_16]OGQ02728.1 MAG: threonylcarbamoyl-AMP synthase [Deltaproteobacteria bacterium RIFCSPHIGHO2_02_FULL_38_15]OGQ31874.1 MAG: threonylcarbamoyl-AMP synthase [Deltaproteobacteria bacterium RIFCSPLOWO2_01_FULL_38_9]OGQ59088.1 MAG: threonylcarbamoyl-AMP synthase [Deltaproteobacteria bacterium RIFCSPLOWO2_12_FULL_38_8]HBQ20588.1 threonylcarbamoyl-AMP synthase [Deltaproteobacteria bacterium]